MAVNTDIIMQKWENQLRGLYGRAHPEEVHALGSFIHNESLFYMLLEDSLGNHIVYEGMEGWERESLLAREQLVRCVVQNPQIAVPLYQFLMFKGLPKAVGWLCN